MPDIHKKKSTDLAVGREKILGHLAMALFAALIAGSFSLGDIIAPHIKPTVLNSIRFLLGTVIMLAASLVIYRSTPTWPKAPWRFAVLGSLMAIYFVTMFMALKISNPVSTGAVFTLIPLMSGGFGWLFLRQTTKPIVIISLIIAAMGAVWVIFKGDIPAILAFNIGKGEAIFFIGCTCHAAYAPLVKKFNRGESTIAFSFFTLAAIFFWISIVGAKDLYQTEWSALPTIIWLGIGYLAFFTTAGTFYLLQFAAMRIPASKVLSYGYLTPSFIILIEGFLGHGWVGMSVMAGALVTAGALMVIALAPDQ